MTVRTATAIGVLVCGVAGCAAVSTPMKHADGRVINCNAAGMGVIGAPAALVMRENCVSNARANGFVPIDEAGPGAGATKVATPYTGKVAVSLPDGWVRTPPPAAFASAIAYAKNMTLDSYMVLSYIDKKDITDVAAYAATKRAAQVSKLREATSSETIKTDIKGRPAYVSDIAGTLPSNGTNYRFRQTVVDSGAEVLTLVVWASAANYDGKVKEHLDGIADGLTGL